MSQYMTSVVILHSGGDEEVRFIQNLEKSLASHTGQSYSLEYTKFQQRQAKEVIMYNDALRCKKEKLPIIVLISKHFFDLIWLTSYKQGILSVITNYSTKNCLHIWMDLTEDYVKYRSNALLRTDGYFRRIKETDLTKLRPADMIIRIQGLINVNGDGKFNPLNNYAVDDEEDEMRRNFERSTFGMELQPAATSIPDGQRARPTKKGKDDVYKDALRMASMTQEEVDAYNRVSASHAGSNVQNTRSNKKKKRNNKNKNDTDSIKLIHVSEKDRKQIANYLDKGAGANWKQLAETFNFDAGVIRKLMDCHPQESQTEKLMALLLEHRPDLELKEFMQNCKLILRTDVPAYILNNILN